MRLTWLSNSPWTAFGYGIQTGLFTTRLNQAGIPTAVISNYGHQGAPMIWNGVQVYGSSFHTYCMDIMHMHSMNWKADAMISLMDLQVFEPSGLQGTKWIAWFPVDHVTIPPYIMHNIRQADFRIAMSQHASKEMDAAGLDYYYIPCGVDTNIYKPLPMLESRETMQLPTDKFIVGMVAANKGNPSRKAFTQNLMAFAALQKKNKDCVLYLHTYDGTRTIDGVNLVEYCKALGLSYGYQFNDSGKGKDVVFADQYGLTIGYDPAMMAQLYSSMDVHLLVTCGEGFGIPLLEAQACGTPVITGNWTSMPELCFSGWKVTEAEPTWTPLEAFQMTPNVGAIADKLEAAYQMRGNQDYRKRARDGAMAYDADRIMEKYWLPILGKIEGKLQEKPQNDTLSNTLSILRSDKHEHMWSQTGLYDAQRNLSFPCITCNDELLVNPRTNEKKVIANGYPALEGLDFMPDSDGINKIIFREVKRDYELDNLDVKAGEYILDIGAHKGIVSCYLAKKYPQAFIYAFEPMIENMMALQENIRRNNLTNVFPVHKAITKDGRDVHVPAVVSGNSGATDIYTKATGLYDNGVLLVESMTLSDVFKYFTINKLALLKIDCEGAEYEILGSANGLLKKIKAVRGEFHRQYGNADELLEHIKRDVADVVVTVQG